MYKSVAIILLILTCASNRFHGFRFAGRYIIASEYDMRMMSTTTPSSTTVSLKESNRLQQARLRLAEAQGRVPWGTADMMEKQGKVVRIESTSISISHKLHSCFHPLEHVHVVWHLLGWRNDRL